MPYDNRTDYLMSVQDQMNGRGPNAPPMYDPRIQSQTDKYGWKPSTTRSLTEHSPTGNFDYAERMRNLAQHNLPGVNINVSGMQPYYANADQSYGQQKASLGLQRQLAMGQGPSVAAIQQNAGQDAALRGMLGHRGAPMLPGAGGGLNNVAVQGAAARGQEIGRAQQGEFGAANAMRGQSLQERGQNLANASSYRNLNLNSQQQDMEREMQLQRLALGGYGQEQQYQNALNNINAGLQARDLERNQQMIGAGISAGSAGMAQLGSMDWGGYGGNNPNQPKPGGYVGSSDWGNHEGYY